MSLIDQVENKNSLLRPSPVSDQGDARRILQASELLSILNGVITGAMIQTKQRKKWSEHRTRLGDCSWRLQNVLGNASVPGWANMVECAIAGMEKTIRHSQPNGAWVIAEYEVDIRRGRDDEERVTLAVLWLDADNKPDLQYQNGVPSVSINVQNPQIPAALMDALSSSGKNDNDLKDLIRGLIETMATQSASAPPASPSGTESFRAEEMA